MLAHLKIMLFQYNEKYVIYVIKKLKNLPKSLCVSDTGNKLLGKKKSKAKRKLNNFFCHTLLIMPSWLTQCFGKIIIHHYLYFQWLIMNIEQYSLQLFFLHLLILRFGSHTCNMKIKESATTKCTIFLWTFFILNLYIW